MQRSAGFGDGLDYEHKLMEMVSRFKNAYEGVPVEAAEAAMCAEQSGDSQLLALILNRQVRLGKMI